MAEVLQRLKAALADRYRIERELGSGGMATVYLAHDIKHDRRVAVKVMRPELSAILGGERFLREIRIAAKLNHPHILALHDSGEAEEYLYYVMPYVEGESLREKLNREKQLSVDEATSITTQVGAALDYAHEQGVIHRDIKPENILIHEGEALVADFGIALAVTAAGGTRLTDTGLSLGTPEYMSPEQATGERELDARSDVYSLGAVIYEMLVGEPPHTGNTVQAIIAKVVSAEPQPVSRIRHSVPANVDAAVQCALAKTPADRFASAGGLLRALSDPEFRGPTLAGTTVVATHQARWPWFAVAWALVITVVGAIALWLASGGDAGVDAPVVKLSVVVPENARPHNDVAPMVAVSPDGARLVYVAQSSRPESHASGDYGPSQVQRLFVRPIDQFQARPIPDTEGARGPFFSPDGEWVGYYLNGTLKRVRLTDGASQTIADSVAADFRGASWSVDGTILIGAMTSGLSRVSAAGGVPVPVTVPDFETGELGHTLPHVLPDGDRALFTVMTGPRWDQTRVAVVSLESGERIPVLESGFQARYLTAGYLVYMDNVSLFAVRFDPESLQSLGEPVPVIEDVRVNVRQAAHFGISEQGTVAYLAGQTRRSNDSLFLVDRTGVATPVPVPEGNFNWPRLSPDGRRLAITSYTHVMGTWILDLERGIMSRLAVRGLNNHLPIWTPDGDRVVFTSDRDGPQDLFWKPVDGAGEAELLYASQQHKDAGSWSPDGELLAFSQADPRTGWDIWVLTVEDSAEARPFLRTQFEEYHPMISPDGRWMAYTSNESGRFEVYLTPFPEGGRKQQVSVSGGNEPIWARGGSELFYRDGSDLMAVPVHTQQELFVGQPTLLFRGPYAGSIGYGAPNYDIAADGRRFLMLKYGEPVLEAPQINVVLNWLEELGERVGR